MLQNLVACKHTIGMRGQEKQQFQFLGRHVNFTIAHTHRIADAVHRKIGVADNILLFLFSEIRARRRGLRSTQHRFHAGQ